MMKEKLKIERLNSTCLYGEDIVLMHKHIFSNSALNEILIYFDSNYINYLDQIIKDEHSYFFIVENGKREVVGFLHLKVLEDEIFLNNFYIYETFQGTGIGKEALGKCLIYFEPFKLKYFGLDVFKSNTKALKWYKRLGLVNKYSKKWVKITYCREINVINLKKITFLRLKDNNGFDSLFYNNEKIATVVNNMYAVLHKINRDIVCDLLLQNDFIIVTSCEIDNRLFVTESLEDSIRMRGIFSDIGEQLKK